MNAIFTSGITEQTTPISKAKEPLSWEEIKTIKGRFSTPNWQSAGDDGVYVNMHIPEFLNVDIAMPTHPERTLERAIDSDLGNTTFTMADGTETPTLDKYLANDYNRVQAIIMAHKGKIIYEAYPGMNPQDFHVWMSASKTTVGTLCILLESEGKMDLEKPMHQGIYVDPDRDFCAFVFSTCPNDRSDHNLVYYGNGCVNLPLIKRRI